MAAQILSGDVRPFIASVNQENFWSFVSVREKDDCWNWTGAKDDRGYGRFHIRLSRNSVALAHRIAFILTNQEAPEAVCHQCDNPSCCNPAHLFGGTRADNNQDMARKGRNRVPKPALRGELHHQAKLTDMQAAEIRSKYAKGGWSQRQLARAYGVSQRSIAKVVRGISFKDAQNGESHTEANTVCSGIFD